MRSLFALVLALAAVPALADESCHVEAGPNDVVKKSGDVIIEAGQVVEDAIAIDGKVILKKGAVVKNAVAFHGDLVIEDGAKVTKTALSVGGAVKVAKGAVVNSTVELSDRGLRMHGKDGDDVDINIVIGGKSLGQRIVDEALSKLKDCQIVAKK